MHDFLCSDNRYSFAGVNFCSWMDEAKAYKGSQAKFCHYFVFSSFHSRRIFFSFCFKIFPAASNTLPWINPPSRNVCRRKEILVEWAKWLALTGKSLRKQNQIQAKFQYNLKSKRRHTAGKTARQGHGQINGYDRLSVWEDESEGKTTRASGYRATHPTHLEMSSWSAISIDHHKVCPSLCDDTETVV